MFHFNTLRAEFIKLKYPPIFWLTSVVLFVMMVILFASHYLDVNAVAKLGDNPWRKMIVATNGIFFIFMAIPFVVLLVGAAIYVEHQANAWKYLYVTPKHRISIILVKLLTLLFWILITVVGLSICMILCGFLLNHFLPELEFNYFPILFSRMWTVFAHSLISLLGVFGIQFFLSLRFKGFLLPVCLGVIGFVVGIIIGSLNSPLAKFYPYSYPLVVKNVEMFRTDKIGIIEYGWINSIELSSMACFFFFVSLALFLESRRGVI